MTNRAPPLLLPHAPGSTPGRGGEVGPEILVFLVYLVILKVFVGFTSSILVFLVFLSIPLVLNRKYEFS